MKFCSLSSARRLHDVCPAAGSRPSQGVDAACTPAFLLCGITAEHLLKVSNIRLQLHRSHTELPLYHLESNGNRNHSRPHSVLPKHQGNPLQPFYHCVVHINQRLGPMVQAEQDQLTDSQDRKNCLVPEPGTGSTLCSLPLQESLGSWTNRHLTKVFPSALIQPKSNTTHYSNPPTGLPGLCNPDCGFDSP